MENIHGKEGVQMEIKVNFEDLSDFQSALSTREEKRMMLCSV